MIRFSRICSYLVALILTYPCGVGRAQGLSTALPQSQFETIGLYAWEPAEEEHYLFWKACGYNFLQFIDRGLWLEPSEREASYERLVKGIDDAHRHGFKVGVILKSNVLPYPHDWWETFDPRDEGQMKARLSAIEEVIKRCRKADVLTFFGGDPGGVPDSLGAYGIALWKDMAKKVHQMVRKHAPKAEFNVNIWAITHWDYIRFNPWATYFWDREVHYGRNIVNDAAFLDTATGLELPMHSYYRSLAFKAYDDVGRKPVPFPVKDDIGTMNNRGIERIWGWAHFLIDEVDDGYTGYSETKVHPTQAETRYIHRLIQDARNMGLNGMVSNCGGPNSSVEAMNVFAFARLCQQDGLTPGQVIDEYASYLAQDDHSQETLGQVIRFIENNSTWEQSIPAGFRVAALDCRFKTAEEALAALATIRPGASGLHFPLLEQPTAYVKRLEERLRDIIYHHRNE